MRAKGRAKRRIAIILTLIMALQSVFAASAFAGTEGDVLNVHITNAYWTVKASENGQAVPFETGFTMTKGQGKGMTAAGSLNYVGGKNNKASGYGVSYTFLNSYVLNEGGPVYTESVASSEAISKINYKGNGEVLVTFADKSTTTLNTTDLYISPAYKVNASWRLAYSYIDNVSTGSGSWYNTTGSTSSFSHTFKDPSKATPVDHYRFVNWTNFETGETYGEGSKYTYQPKDQAFLNSYYAENGSLYEDEVNIYAVWQPSVTVNWYDEAGNQIRHIEEFDNDIAAYSYEASDITGAEGETYTFEGWETADGSMVSADEIYTVPEVTTEKVNQKVIDLYPVYHTTKSVEKVWNDEDNRDGIRAEEITVQLFANGAAADTAVLSEDNGWAYTFEGLDAFANGEAIVYTVDEMSEIEGYAKEISYSSLKDIITNTHEAAKTEVTVTKVWEDSNDKLNVRPLMIEVTLLANGEAVETATITENEAGEWTYTFEDLYKYENGEEIVYTVEEGMVPDYEASIEGNAEEGFVITNTCTAKVPVPVKPVIPVGPVTPADNTSNTPAVPVGPVADNAPAQPAQAQPTQAAQTEIVEEAAPMAAAPASVEIAEDAAPMAAGTGYWALLNLILAAATALMSLLAMAFYFIRKRNDEEDENEEENEIRRKGILRILTIIPAVAAIITFILTENMANPMRIADDWTLLMAIFFAAGAVLTILSRKTVKENENDEQAAPEMA